MAKVTSDVGAVAKAWQSTMDLIRKLFETSETRKLKDAARAAQSYIRRNERINPKAKQDNMLRKYKKRFEEKII